METNPGFSTSFRVLRGAGGKWEVMEEGQKAALARFEAPQAALSYACSVAEARHGSLVVVFDEPRRRLAAHDAPPRPRTAPAMGRGAPR
jgi:hypothetical protein